MSDMKEAITKSLSEGGWRRPAIVLQKGIHA